jgi:hypothetical protein
MALLDASGGFTELVALYHRRFIFTAKHNGFFAVEYFDHAAGMATVFDVFADQQA